tara:strand:+ start:23 stop:256 length:234 start_codon:yes stop_codon:yes gene_type:complete
VEVETLNLEVPEVERHFLDQARVQQETQVVFLHQKVILEEIILFHFQMKPQEAVEEVLTKLEEIILMQLEEMVLQIL